MNVVALIPAKGCSERIPGKNLRLLGGRPLLAWTIEAALLSECVTRVVVSTESPEVAAVARENGAEVQDRPAELAHDPAEAQDVAAYAFGLLADVDVAVMLLPTSPFRTAQHIDQAVDWHLWDREHRNVVSVTSRPEGKVKWHASLSDGLRLLNPPHPCELNGAIYVGPAARVVADRGFRTDGALPYPIPRNQAIDIDRESDWIYAEALLESALVP